MKKEVFAKSLTALCLAGVLLVSPGTAYHISADAKVNVLSLYANQLKFDVDGVSYPLNDDILLYYSNIFISVDDVLPKCGFTLGWDAAAAATVAVKDGETSLIAVDSAVLDIGGKRYEYDLPTMVYHGRLYISLNMFTDLTHYYVTLDGKLEETHFNKRDLLQSTYVSDAYRLPDTDISYANGVTMAGNFAFERLAIPDESARNYAYVVNEVAAALPNVKTYCIIVPTSAEFYAPVSLAVDQTSSIRTAYSALSDKVMPINAVQPLLEHAGEKIYFATDHHWTQRGAYYVYRAFAANKGMTLPDLSEFPANNSDSHVGSFANFAGRTAVGNKIRSNPELLERFLPVRRVNGAAYSDMKMTKKRADIVPVSVNMNSYSCFIGGDNPVTVMTTDVNNGKKIAIIKESFGNAFATWALNNYSEVYVIDPRKFNGFGGSGERFSLTEFHAITGFDDLVIISYPVSVSSGGIRESILKMVK